MTIDEADPCLPAYKLIELIEKKVVEEIAREVDLQFLKHIDFGAYAQAMVLRDRPELAGKVLYRKWCSDVVLRDQPGYPNGRPLAYFVDMVG